MSTNDPDRNFYWGTGSRIPAFPDARADGRRLDPLLLGIVTRNLAEAASIARLLGLEEAEWRVRCEMAWRLPEPPEEE